MLRLCLRTLLAAFGIEILHIELGQDPYDYDAEKDAISARPYRTEHFGFRDGISQPFVNMNLGAPDAGGGTPDRNRGWSVVAPGEIFLGHPDEEGVTHLEPANSTLRNNGTFLVFRKLEQDVIGFRNYLREQRTDPGEQNKLAAQFMGRWPSGVSLVHAPKQEIAAEALNDIGINDFLFAADDPNGLKCPLGSHVRRSNPRDTGGGNEVRRHRILRRSISYGGSLLPKDSTGDEEKRGLLFVAANSRIEQQFEVIQSEWINGSEFLGQAGLGKCPVTGRHKGSPFDIFHEAQSPIPVTNLPTFVITRGGDYFFAPSATAIRQIAKAGSGEEAAAAEMEEQSAGADSCASPGEEKSNEQTARATPCDRLFCPDSRQGKPHPVGRARTPELFEPDRLKSYLGRFLAQPDKAIRVGLQNIPEVVSAPTPHKPKEQDETIGSNVVFVGKHADVRQILGGNPKMPMPPGDISYDFSVAHYRQVARRVLRGGLIPVATELGGETDDDRRRLHDIFATAWIEAGKHGLRSRIERLAEANFDRALQSARKVGRIDLVHDLATRAVYDVIAKCYGVPGPGWLTELAISLPFARNHVGELYPDWLDAISRREVRNPPQTTLQIWSILFFADLITNVKSQQELHDFGTQAGTEFITHIDRLLMRARRHGPVNAPTLLDAFVAIEQTMTTKYGISSEEYFRDAAAVLLELTAATMLNIPAVYGNVMGFTLKARMDLASLIPLLDEVVARGWRPALDL